MHVSTRLAVVAVCSLPLLLAGCSNATPHVQAEVVQPTAADAAVSADTGTATMPGSNPVLVTLTGTVLSLAGEPVPAASVQARPAASSKDCLSCGGAHARTDSSGRFRLTLARGDYTVMCSAPGGMTCRLEDVSATGTATVSAASDSLVLLATRASH